jgi:hypothetical protein
VQGDERREEEEEEENLFIFNDTIEGPRAPAVRPGRIRERAEELWRRFWDKRRLMAW